MKLKNILITLVMLNNTYYFSKCYAKDTNKNQILTEESLKKSMETIPQDLLKYIKRSHKIDDDKAIKIKNKFLKRYYLPWTDPYKIISLNEVKNSLLKRIERFTNNPGYGANKKPLPHTWLNEIKVDINLSSFPNCNKYAINIRDTNLRLLPCDTPSFTNFTDPGEGYPFDNLQDSFLQAFEPIYVIHQTNKGWSFVIDSRGTYSWIRTNDLAFVDKKFKEKWMNMKLIAILSDKVIIKYDTEVVNGRIGQLLPYNGKKNKIYAAIKNRFGFAKLIEATINSNEFTAFPLYPSVKNIAKVGNKLMEFPYGWGGMYGYRDCSSLLKDLFTTIGLFLPRDSGPQANAGKFVDISELSKEEKYKKIIKEGIPFFTLIRMSGHIFLYIGHRKGVPYVFHSIFAFKTKVNEVKGRCVVGETIIMPLNLDENYVNTDGKWIDRIIGFTILTPTSLSLK